jgi:hypothetical protein
MRKMDSSMLKNLFLLIIGIIISMLICSIILGFDCLACYRVPLIIVLIILVVLFVFFIKPFHIIKKH